MLIRVAVVVLLLLSMWTIGEVAERVGKRVRLPRLAKAIGTVGIAGKLGAYIIALYAVVLLVFLAVGLLPPGGRR